MAHKPFRFGCTTDIFHVDELGVLQEHGARLEALASGSLSAATPEEEHFLLVDREQAEPESLAERAWVRLKGRREFEAEESRHSVDEPADNYGIIEWDKEKCWW